jgi:hypothetical protein
MNNFQSASTLGAAIEIEFFALISPLSVKLTKKLSFLTVKVGMFDETLLPPNENIAINIILSAADIIMIRFLPVKNI